MQIIVNDAPCETAAIAVSELLHEHAADPARVAVVLNERIVPAATYPTQRLAAGDRVELLAFAAGG